MTDSKSTSLAAVDTQLATATTNTMNTGLQPAKTTMVAQTAITTAQTNGSAAGGVLGWFDGLLDDAKGLFEETKELFDDVVDDIESIVGQNNNV